MKKKILFLFFMLGTLVSSAANNDDIEAMVEMLLNRMTLEEKVRLCYAQSKFSSPGVPRLGVPEVYTSDGPHGVRMEINWNDWDHAGWTNDSCTAFPALTCLAATWQPELASLYGRMVGEEARYRNKTVLLGPGVNLYRTPLNGRNFEYMGEDPYLASRMCVPYIQGLQSNGVACCIKHYALNEQETFRNHVDVRVSDRAMYELYLRPFHAAVTEGGAWSLMGSYNRYLNQHATHNARLINDILKREWGFDGVVITDWGAAHNTDEAIFNGLDLEMGSFTDGLSTEAPIDSYDDYYLGRAYLEKCRRGEVPDSIVDDKARRMLRLILRTGMAANRGFGAMNSPEHVAAARRIAQEGIVLLKNNGILPLVPEEGMKILVVGENAVRSLCAGGGSSELKPRDEVSPLRGIRERFGDRCVVEYAKGYESGRSMFGEADVLPQSLYDSLRNEAVGKAKDADYVIYVGGLNKNHTQDCEGGDREHYQLPFGQDRLIAELLAANSNTVVVMVSGNAYDMPWLDKAPALVQSWYLGSEAGHALADIISGDVCPSGKLPFTFACQLTDYPAHKMGAVGYPGVSPDKLPQPFGGEEGKPMNSARLLKAAVEGWKGINFCNEPGNGARKDETGIYGEDILLGYRWFDYFKTKVRFPFGFGLSYTTFSYGKPVIDGRTVSVSVRNSGNVLGQEVVQFYVGDDKASVIRPVKELKHFEKVALAPGETKLVSYTIDDDDLKFFDEEKHEWVMERGTFTVYVGASAADIRGKVKFCLVQAEAQDVVLEINTRKRGAEIAPTMYGVFFEDINYGADGGLYGELIKNRSFEFPQPLMGWNTIGGVEVKDDGPFSRSPHYVRLSYSGKRDMATGMENEGFLGMSLHGGEQYRFTVWARVPGDAQAQLDVGLRDLDSQEENFTVCEADINVCDNEWRKYTVLFTPPYTIRKASLAIFLKGNAPVDVEHVSLFPVDTWCGHENGLRKDLAQHLANLKPGVMRFPGGCIVEGATLDTRYNWKHSIGPVENRPLNETRWNYGKERTHFDYYQSYGLGFFEFFQFCEEIGAEPLPVLSCGMACQFNNDISTKGSWIAKGDSLNGFIQDAIDLIEFCNGDPEKNEWAKIRADMGHPAPFNLKYLAIGNEQWGEWYAPMLKAFMKPIRELYPQIRIVGSSGPWPDGKEYDYLWPEMRKAGVDFVDEHFYRDEEFFLSGVNRYDGFPRKGPKVYAGEYACHGTGKKWNRFYSAICEAAFMTGLERNADVVRMATYAPLFAHIDGWQWRPDMIWFDNLRSVCTASYYVQQLFSTNRGTHVLPITVTGNTNKIYTSAVVDSSDQDAVIVKVVNTGEKDIQVSMNLKGMSCESSMITTVLSASENCSMGNVNYDGNKVHSILDCDNSLDNPIRILPDTVEAKVMCPHITVRVEACSVSIFRFKPC